MVARASASVVAVHDGCIAGFARAVTDGVANGYVGTVAVDPALRGRGIGRALVAAVTGKDPRITWLLRARPGSEAFWAACGFAPSAVAMERRRRDPDLPAVAADRI